MSDSHLLRGLGVALVTPFHADGSIDFLHLKSLLSINFEVGLIFWWFWNNRRDSNTR